MLKKNAQTIKDCFENILISSKRKPNLIETDNDKEFYINTFQIFVESVDIKHCSRKTYLAAVFAEKINRTIGDIQNRPVFEKGNSTWIDILQSKTKHYINRILSST